MRESPSAKTNNTRDNNDISQVLASIRKRLGEQVHKRAKSIRNQVSNSGVACSEPCPFIRCLKTCRHEQETEHEDHYCSDHCNRPKVLQQQKAVTVQVQQSQNIGNADGTCAMPSWTKPKMEDIGQDKAEESEEMCDLVDESDSDGEAPAVALADSSDDDSEEETEEYLHERQQATESITGHLDFDYSEVNFVKPSGQLQNIIKNFVGQTWNIVNEEHHSYGPLKWYPQGKVPSNAPMPDPTQVWWTESYQERVKPSLVVQKYYEQWRSFPHPGWISPIFPSDLDPADVLTAKKEAKTLPEQFYTYTQLPVITPDNLQEFLEHMSCLGMDLDVHIKLWSWFSGTGRLLNTAKENGYAVLFPVDLRYGWDIRRQDVQKKLKRVDYIYKPQVTSMEPRCKYWSIAGRSRSPDVTRQERNKEEQMLQFLVKHCHMLEASERLALVENPKTSDIWTDAPLKDLQFEEYELSQCAHSELPDGKRSRKETIIKANFPLTRTATGCTCAEEHVVLRGKLTSEAAAFSQGLCDSLIQDLEDATATDGVEYPWQTHPTKRVRTADDLAKEAALKLTPGGLHTKHLQCPYCVSWFSSSSALRYHKMTHHLDQFNADRQKRGLDMLTPPVSKYAKIEKRILPESVEPMCSPDLAAPRNPDFVPRVNDSVEQIQATTGTWDKVPAKAFVYAPSRSSLDPTPVTGQWQQLPIPAIRARRKPMIKNLLRGIRTYKKDARYAGGVARARNMLANQLLQRLQPGTNPVGAEQLPEASSPRIYGPQQEEQSNANLGNTQGEPPRPTQAPTVPPQPSRRVRRKFRKTHPDDLTPYGDDFYAYLTAEDIPDLQADDLLVGNDADLPPEARKCSIDVRRAIRNAHNNLGHPSNHALVRLM